MAPSIIVALLLAVAAPPVELRPEAADVVCPRPAELSTALRAHLAPRASERAWTLAYAAPVGDGAERTLRLELRDATQEVRLRRMLAISADGCADAAEAVALVIERYFTGIGWTAGAPPAVAARAPAPAPAPPAAGRGRITALAGVALVRDASWAARAAIDLRWNVLGPLTLGAGVLLPGQSRSEPVGESRARVQVSAWPAARLSLLVGRALTPRLALDGGLDGFVALESAHPETITMPADGRRLVANLGVAAVGSWLFSRRWQLVLEAGGYRHFGPTFDVTDGGQPRRVLEASPWQAAFMGRLGFVLGR